MCDELMSEFWGIQNGAGYPRIGLSLLAPVVGLILGVPIVAREIELRTTELAWSLALRRSRWLLSRLLPMVVLALVGFVVLGWLGVRLFTRTTRQVALTEAGARLMGDAARILAELAAAEASASGAHEAPQGVLRVTAPVQFGQRFIAPILRDYLESLTGKLAEIG
ncbi:MAG: hypothetical protein ACC726_16475, partial [Chloroflexota bacterium]